MYIGGGILVVVIVVVVVILLLRRLAGREPAPGVAPGTRRPWVAGPPPPGGWLTGTEIARERACLISSC